MSVEYTLQERAALRLAEVLGAASFPKHGSIMNGFGAAWQTLQDVAREGIKLHGATPLEPEEALERVGTAPQAYVGPPDRLHSLCGSGYAECFSRALVAGAPVLPLVRRGAQLMKVALIEALSHESFGLYAMKMPAETVYMPLVGVDMRVAKPGTEIGVPDGLPGEVLVRAAGDSVWVRTGIISALEQVPHRFREPGLVGWLGPVETEVSVAPGQSVPATALDAVEKYDEAILDARLIIQEGAAISEAVLQVETEAGSWIEDDVAQRFYTQTGFRPKIERIPPGRLPQTGRRFARARTEILRSA